MKGTATTCLNMNQPRDVSTHKDYASTVDFSVKDGTDRSEMMSKYRQVEFSVPRVLEEKKFEEKKLEAMIIEEKNSIEPSSPPLAQPQRPSLIEIKSNSLANIIVNNTKWSRTLWCIG